MELPAMPDPFDADVVIIGGGCAGLTAAIYTARASLKTILLDKLDPGGQLATTHEVENYPGFPDVVMGPDLMERFLKQAQRFGTEVRSAEVKSISAGDPVVRVVHAAEGDLRCKAVLVCTGADPKRLGVPGEDRLRGRGVSYCGPRSGQLALSLRRASRAAAAGRPLGARADGRAGHRAGTGGTGNPGGRRSLGRPDEHVAREAFREIGHAMPAVTGWHGVTYGARARPCCQSATCSNSVWGIERLARTPHQPGAGTHPPVILSEVKRSEESPRGSHCGDAV